MRFLGLLASSTVAASLFAASAAAGQCIESPAERGATMDAAIRGSSPLSAPGDVVFLGRVRRLAPVPSPRGLVYSPDVEVVVEATFRGHVPSVVHTLNNGGCTVTSCSVSSVPSITLLPGQRMVFLTRVDGASFGRPSGCGGDVWGLTLENARRIAAKYKVAFTELPDSAVDYVVPKPPRPTRTPAPAAAAPTAERRNTAVPTAIAALLVLALSAALGALRRAEPPA